MGNKLYILNVNMIKTPALIQMRIRFNVRTAPTKNCKMRFIEMIVCVLESSEANIVFNVDG